MRRPCRSAAIQRSMHRATGHQVPTAPVRRRAPPEADVAEHLLGSTRPASTRRPLLQLPRMVSTGQRRGALPRGPRGRKAPPSGTARFATRRHSDTTAHRRPPAASRGGRRRDDRREMSKKGVAQRYAGTIRRSCIPPKPPKERRPDSFEAAAPIPRCRRYPRLMDSAARVWFHELERPVRTSKSRTDQRRTP